MNARIAPLVWLMAEHSTDSATTSHAGQQPVARSVGTTVSVKELFKSLPVRHKAFQRSVKKEFVKLVQLLQAYALVSTSVKILATNQVRPHGPVWSLSDCSVSV